MSTVVLVPLSTYEQPKVDAAVAQGISLLGGIERFVKPEEKILLKPNLLCAAAPEKAVTTHPAVFSAVCKLLTEAGYKHLSYGDSPGSTTSFQRAAKVCGLAPVAEKYGIRTADFDNGSMVSFPSGETAHSFYLSNGVQEADALINLCKMKTHALERITGAVKNLYGCITGVNKAAGHCAYPNAMLFADMLADLHRSVKPRLHIMDAVLAMEGNGPQNGTPIAMNMLLMSDDPVALDSVFASLVYVSPDSVPTNVSASRAGLGTMNTDEITVVTPDGKLSVAQAASAFGNEKYDVDRHAMKEGLMFRLAKYFPNQLQMRPTVDLSRCVACGICEDACPVDGKAVHSGKGKKAQYDYTKCIRCYCCQEMCPKDAIRVYKPLIVRLMSIK